MVLVSLKRLMTYCLRVIAVAAAIQIVPAIGVHIHVSVAAIQLSAVIGAQRFIEVVTGEAVVDNPVTIVKFKPKFESYIR